MVLITAAAGNALRMDLFNFDLLTHDDAVIVTQSSSSLVIDVEGRRYAFSGVGVRYNDYGEPTSGTITGFTFSELGNVMFQVNGVSGPAAQFYLWANSGSNPMPLLLGGNDDYRGSAFDDVIIDYNGHNNLLGGAGSDVLTTGSGNDHIYGQSPEGGDDGVDVIRAGDGSDYVNGNAGSDNIEGGGGSDRLYGGQDDDYLNGQDGNDTINGNRGNDLINGGGGNDSLRGGQGDDAINGEDGNDILSGDLGADSLRGGNGADVLTGGDGADLFLFGTGNSAIGASIDSVTDFQQGSDLISLGFLPRSVVVGADAPTIDAARIAAQALLDDNPGDYNEVAAIGYQGGTLLFWANAGFPVIDSVANFQNQSPADFTLADFG